MTRTEITSMPPGKRMDELCARAMMVEPKGVRRSGPWYTKVQFAGRLSDMHARDMAADCKIDDWLSWPKYSTDIRETQKIVRWMHRARNCLTLSYTSDWKRPGKMVWTADFRMGGGCYAMGQTESLAICRAFLVHRYGGPEAMGYGHGQ